MEKGRTDRFSKRPPNFFPERYDKYATKDRKEKIHREDKLKDNLPFKFSKPKKVKACTDFYECNKCGKMLPVSFGRTHVIVCGDCNNFMVIEIGKIISSQE